MKKVGLLFDDRYLLHDPGGRHPESPQRLRAVQRAFDTLPAIDRWARIEPRPAHPSELGLIHLPWHLEQVEKASKHAPAYLDPDTPVSEQSYRVALLSVGGVLQCVDEICSSRLQRAFAFVRPPGHHAGPAKSMGFCLFNNVAVAAAYARRNHGIERVAIVDIDLHHGNGTQECFYGDPQVLFVSSHQFPFYPGTGAFREIGTGAGRGFTLNLPLPAGTGDSTVVPLYSRIVSAVLADYAPQLIVVSAGFDAYADDPLGDLQVTAGGYGSVAAALLRASDSCCQGRILFVLEGGYSQEGLQSCTREVMAEMEAEEPQDPRPAEDALFRQISLQAAESYGGRWKW
jgi:acetoin utilization deacetylase AcuC-like enzyme